ncbi:MAG: helix-turn-helix transcriptional regulator [Eubacteriales bacterium]|nr:helix-turn-helix transcriptional regulator [Eubacteriales bacterium]
MRSDRDAEKEFFVEMSEYQITAREFFNDILLDSIKRNFGLTNEVITYFDTHGKFLSWTRPDQIMLSSPDHPYSSFVNDDPVRKLIYQEAVRDHLTYFNVEPRLYRATDVIGPDKYEDSEFLKFIEKHFNAHYSVTLAFGINAYIMVTFLKTEEEGDYTDEEMNQLGDIYVYLAEAYKNFKKYEQRKIVTNIQNEIMLSGEKAYLVTDDFTHVMSHNDLAKQYLEDILGTSTDAQIDGSQPASWLPFLLGRIDDSSPSDRVETKVIRGYIFKVYTYDQTYSNGIVDRYHWITISKKRESVSQAEAMKTSQPLTPTEKKVAQLLYKGLTYRAIADKLVISYHTVKKHVENIYSKCGVNSRFELYKLLENSTEDQDDRDTD